MNMYYILRIAHSPQRCAVTLSPSALPTGAPGPDLLFGLLDSAAEGSIQSTQMKLKRARLADDLNEKIALRPGPLELVEKNIIPVDSAVKEAIKGVTVNVCAVCVQGVGQGLPQ